MCDESEPCCNAINKAFSGSALIGARLIEAARIRMEIDFAGQPAEIVAREQAAFATLLAAGDLSRTSFARLLELSRCCDLICCRAAAKSLGKHYLTLVQGIVSATSARGIPAVPPFPPPPIVNLPQALAAVLASNQQSFDFILQTVSCTCKKRSRKAKKRVNESDE